MDVRPRTALLALGALFCCGALLGLAAQGALLTAEAVRQKRVHRAESVV